MSDIEVFYDEDLPITMNRSGNGMEPHVCLHYVSCRRGEFAYVKPIGALTLESLGIRSPAHKWLREELPPTHKLDRELLPLMPSWVPTGMGREYNEEGQYRK